MAFSDESAAILRQAQTVVCRDPRGGRRWLVFTAPEEVLTAWTVDEVGAVLAEVERRLAAGFWIAGALAYESAPAFDPAHRTHVPDSITPLAWFGVYRRPGVFRPAPVKRRPARLRVTPVISRNEYLAAVGRVKEYIRAGDIYQANLTFPARSAVPAADPAGLFLELFQAHPVPAAAWLNAGPWQLASLSPEIFLIRHGREIRSLPMKGTARRETTAAADRRIARELGRDPKNRAENVMITDMVRNDFGRICRPGSIRVDPLCRVDTYATVHQMISEVHGRVPTGTSLSALLGAAYPAASITGAPKIRAMEIIHELEPAPRRFYTGSIGAIAPNGDLFLSVAIRTLLCLPDQVELGIGSGIVADSVAAEEWRECLLKSRFVQHRQPEFDILETMLWSRDSGWADRAAHLARARNSQHYFGRPWRAGAVIRALDDMAAALAATACPRARVRLRVNRTGQPHVESQPLPQPGWGKAELTVRLTTRPVRSTDRFLYHKTTCRQRYDREFRAALTSGCDEVLFYNERGELTEGAISNILVRIGRRWFTPPLACGLLPGIWRANALRELRAGERILTLSDLAHAAEIRLGNSVRGAARVGRIVGLRGGWTRPDADTRTNTD